MADDVTTERSCTDCMFALFQDSGYSNYTIEGTDFFCMQNVHPEDGFDAWYKTDKRLKFAAKCPTFTEGEAVHLDVELEDITALSPSQRAIYDNWDRSDS